MRNIKIASGEYYHIYNRGVNKQNIFVDNRDWTRFLFLILYLQSPTPVYNISQHISFFIKNRVFNISTGLSDDIFKKRCVNLVSFCIMPNHFHLICRQLTENGVSKYMEKIQKAYAKYINAKHKKSGHLFQGPYQIIHVKNNEQLLYLSAYIHRNSHEIKEWKSKEDKYPWSSYQDYVGKNRWGKFLEPDIILGQFSTSKEYKNFVENSRAKSELDKEILLE